MCRAKRCALELQPESVGRETMKKMYDQETEAKEETAVY